MSFADHIRQTLRAAAPNRYPIMIDKDLYAVETVHDDYADLHPGSVTDDGIVSVSRYTRAVQFDGMKSVEAVPDWRIRWI